MSKQVATIAASLLLAAGVGGAVGRRCARDARRVPTATPASTAQPVAQTTSPIAAVYRRQGRRRRDFDLRLRAVLRARLRDRQGRPHRHQPARRLRRRVCKRQFADGSEETAEIVGTDPSTDIAVLDVDRPSSLLTPLSFAAERVAPGREQVIAIGSPFSLEGTLTAGVSAPSGVRSSRRTASRSRTQSRRTRR